MRKIHVPLRTQVKGRPQRKERGCCSNTRNALSSPEYSSIVAQGSIFALVLCITILMLHFAAPDDFYGSLFRSGKDVTLSELFPDEILDGQKLAMTSDILQSARSDVGCADQQWCGIAMPRKSLFGFAPPTDVARWQWAKAAAAKGEHILLREVNKAITSPFDLLDGDPYYRRHHFMADMFVDEARWLAPIAGNNQNFPNRLPGSSTGMTGVKTNVYERVPEPYNFSAVGRAPIVQVGYSVLNKNNNAFFTGDYKGTVKISRKLFLQEWSHVRGDIAVKYILVVLTDPEWGWLSSYVPGRTLDKGRCCKEEGDEFLQSFLDDKNLLLLVVNQHTTISHPKILSLPRGLPTKWEHYERIAFDSLHLLLAENKPKSHLLIAPSSTWKNSE
jgi:hypothetical protein